jgi:hypothetical protein
MAALRFAFSSAALTLVALALLVGVTNCASVASHDGDDGGIDSGIDSGTGGGGGDMPRDMARKQDAAEAAPRLDLSTPPDLTPAPVLDMTALILYEISSKTSGQLLSLRGLTSDNGTKTEQQPKVTTSRPDQRWQVRAAAAGAFEIVNGQSGTCMEVAGGSKADEAAVQIWTCSGLSGQAWQLRDASNGYYNLVNVNSQSCLDLDHARTDPGATIFQFKCNGADNQKWLLTRLP